MSVGLRYLYEEIKKHGVELASGEEGLKNKVNWIQIVESVETAEFLRGNEFAFSTGLIIKTEEDLFDLVKKTNEKGASALIVFVGKYVQNISNELVDYCNKETFPLFVAPWGVDMSTTMKDITAKIIDSEKRQSEILNAIKDAIFIHESKDLYLPVFRRLGYKSEWEYIMSLIDIEPKDVNENNTEDYTSSIMSYIEEELNTITNNYICVDIVSSILIVFYNKNKSEIESIIKKLYVKIIKKFTHLNFYVGINQRSYQLENLYKGYEETKKISKINKLLIDNDINVKSNELIVYKLLLSIADKEILKSFYESTVGNLETYDKLNDTDYVDLLINYFENNCKVNETANALYIHRNTVKYKIKKIEEILDINLSDISDRNKIYIALMIRQLI